MDADVLMNSKGGVESPRSAYQPGEEIQNLTLTVRDAIQDGKAVMEGTYDEYNGMSFIDRARESQHVWLSHPDAPYVGDDEWRWNGVRPLTRNRVIFTAARLTSSLLYPKTFARDDADQEDKDAAYAMDALVEYNIRNSNYETAFLFGVISALVNPINFFSVEYCESWQEAWQNGNYERVIDDIFSGFQYGLVPMDEMLFSSAFIYEWQQQDWVIRTRRITYEEAEGKFGDHEYWPHVQEGTQQVCMDGLFYDIEDVNDDMVTHVNYKHRRSDLELDFVNGIYLSNENTKFNPFRHRRIKTIRGKSIEVPLYDTAKYGYEPIDAMRFIGYKSLVDKMSNDQDAADREWQDFFDASKLATFNPVLLMGSGEFDKSVVAPAAVTEIGEKAKALPIQVSSPLPALQALREAERSGNESSVDPQAGGIKQGGEKTKYETALLEDNTDTNLSMTAKLIARMVKEIGGLAIDDIVRHQTIGEAGAILGQMLYKTFAIGDRVRQGKGKTTYVRFTDRYAGMQMTDKEREMASYRLMKEAGDDKEIIDANPSVFARRNFFAYTDADQLARRNTTFERTFKIAAYEKAMSNPLVMRDPDAQLKITRDFLFEPLMGANAGYYLPDVAKVAAQLIPGKGQDNNPGGGFPQAKPPLSAQDQAGSMM